MGSPRLPPPPATAFARAANLPPTPRLPIWRAAPPCLGAAAAAGRARPHSPPPCHPTGGVPAGGKELGTCGGPARRQGPTAARWRCAARASPRTCPTGSCGRPPSCGLNRTTARRGTPCAAPAAAPTRPAPPARAASRRRSALGMVAGRHQVRDVVVLARPDVHPLSRLVYRHAVALRQKESQIPPNPLGFRPRADVR